MNDIKVGDRVHDFCYGNGTALALHLAADGECWVWSEYDKPKTCYGTRITDLTHIEPEPVVLTPKYAVAQRLRTSPLRLNTTADNIYVVKGPVVGYELESGGWLPESLLSPIPDPCPECGGSGVASE